MNKTHLTTIALLALLVSCTSQQKSTEVAYRSCASARLSYGNAQEEYARLGQQLTQEVTSRYGERIRGAEITQVSNELYVKSKPAADRVAAAQIEYQEACKSMSTNNEVVSPADFQPSKKSEEKEEGSVVESTGSFSTLPPEELAIKNNIIEQEKQRTASCIEKMRSGEIEAYNLCIKISKLK